MSVRCLTGSAGCYEINLLAILLHVVYLAVDWAWALAAAMSGGPMLAWGTGPGSGSVSHLYRLAQWCLEFCPTRGSFKHTEVA